MFAISGRMGTLWASWEADMPKVEIAHDVYAALQRRAIPFEDDINDVLRRLLRERGATNPNGPLPAAGPRGPGRTLNAVPTETTATAPTIADRDGDDFGSVIVRRRSPSGEHLAQSTVRSAVLAILTSSRDAVSVTELFRVTERQLRRRMTDRDLETLPAGITQWQVQTRNALTQLEHEGRIERIGDDLYRSRTKHMTG
jgi:hypothetical protein